MDGTVHRFLEVVMDELKWELLTEVQGRFNADILKSYFEVSGIEVEIFQEAISHLTHPTTFAPVEIFVLKEQADTARKLLEEYNNASEQK
jgi:hypothetical protein